MKAAKTWCLAGLVLVAGLSSASCGKDEGTGGDGGNGSVIGGSGGTAGTGGNTGRAGGGSTGTAATKLGQGCLNDSQCEDTKAPGLMCVTAKETVLGNGAPPKGLCTAECASDDDCSAFGAGALCYPFDENGDTGYCVEGCSFGGDIDAPKCHDRPEFACNPALLGKTSTVCADSQDCQSGELCVNGTCDVVFPACLPTCRGDLDCEAGMYCDQSFLSGVCVAEKQTGKALGEPCTVPADSAPPEPDGCLGFCQADDAKTNKGHCATNCGFGNLCAWNSETEKYDGLCAFLSALTADSGDAGDFGFCTLTCNCSGECKDPGLGCSLLTQGALDPEAFRGAGLCSTPDAMTKEYDQCTGAGGGGAGGADSTGSGGVPAGGDGAGGGG